MGYTFEGVEVKTLGEYYGRRSGQDYQAIRKSLTPGVPWVDPDFSEKDPETLGKKASNPAIFWSRAKDVIPDPEFVSDQECSETKCSRFDIIQGALSDCWLLVAIDVLAEKPALLRMVVPEDNSFENDNSVFHFRFWRSGVWVDVVVDDRLPCFKASEGGKIITKVAFARNRGNEFWVPLLEKAYAKMYGSYSMLQFGMIGDALVDLTGGICATMTLRSPTSDSPKKILEFMASGYERGAMIGLGICIGTGTGGQEVGAGEIKMDNGLARGHAYSVTGLGQIPYQGKNLLLVRVRNPWGTEFEWNGAWSDDSPEWKEYDQQKLAGLNLKKGDGEFWMTYKDVQRNFDLLSVCNMPPRVAKEVVAEGIAPTVWTSHEFHGIWPGAGSENLVEMFKNPQFLLDLTPNENDQVEVLVSVFNKSIRLTGKDLVANKFFNVIFTVRAGPSTITKKFGPSAVETGSLVQAAVPTPEDMRETFEIHTFRRDRYLIIPTLGGVVRGTPGSFLLRVYTDGRSAMTHLM